MHVRNVYMDRSYTHTGSPQHALKDAFVRKYQVEVTKEKEMEVTVPFVFLAKDEMAAEPYCMSETLLLQAPCTSASAPETHAVQHVFLQLTSDKPSCVNLRDDIRGIVEKANKDPQQYVRWGSVASLVASCLKLKV